MCPRLQLMLLFIICLDELGKLRRTLFIGQYLAHVVLQCALRRPEERVRLWALHSDILVSVFVYFRLLFIHHDYFLKVAIFVSQFAENCTEHEDGDEDEAGPSHQQLEPIVQLPSHHRRLQPQCLNHRMSISVRRVDKSIRQLEVTRCFFRSQHH